MNTNIITSKIHPKYQCENCLFKCSKTGDWNRHIATAKHKRLINTNDFTSNYINKLFECSCGKMYKHMSSLCNHKKKCSIIYEEDKMIDGINIKDKDALVMHLLKQNSELQHKIIDMASNTTFTNSNNNHSNNNNKTFTTLSSS